MSRARVWKSLASLTGACGLLLSAAGVSAAGATPSARPQGEPPINCATAEHVGFGAVWHMFNECPGSHNAVDGK